MSILSELSCCLKTFIHTLPTTQKYVLESTYFKEMSLVEYSNSSNINLSTVKSHSKRGKNKLKDLFSQCCNFQNNHKDEIVDYTVNKNNNCNCS